MFECRHSRFVGVSVSSEQLLNGAPKLNALPIFSFNSTETFPIISISRRLFVVHIIRDIESIDSNGLDVNRPDKHLIHHLVLIETVQPGTTDERINRMLVQFWKRKYLNVLIVFRDNRQNIRIASYNPFSAKKFDYHTAADAADFRFPDKTANLNGCTLKATIFHDVTRATFNQSNPSDVMALDGADGLLAQLIAQFMNASLLLLSPSDGCEIGEFLPNGSATGCLGQLVRHEADYGVNVRFYRLNQFVSSIEATTTNGRDDICILVPRPGKATDIGNIFRAFTSYDWIVIIVAWPIYAFFYRCIDYARNRSPNRQVQTMLSILFDLFAMNLGQTAQMIPQHWMKRALIGIWLIYALLITSLYQSMLSGNLIIPNDLPDINFIAQLDQSHFNVITYSRYNRQILEFLTDTQSNGTYRRLPKRLYNATQSELFREISKHNRTVAFANKHHINVYLRRIHRENSGEPIYNEMKQCPVPYVTVYGLAYGTPYKGRINYIIQQAQESGLIEKWGRIDKVHEKMSQSKFRADHDHVPFSLTHLRTAFFVYLIGCTLAVAAFLLELKIGLT